MWEWYWGLSGLTWFLATLAFGGLNIGLLGLVVVWSAKSIAKAFDHELQTCSCARCEAVRRRSLDRQGYSSTRRGPVGHPGTMISTAELQPGMIVEAAKNNHAYEFQGRQKRAYGYVCIFTNLRTNERAWITVPVSHMHHKMWRIADHGIRRVMGL